MKTVVIFLILLACDFGIAQTPTVKENIQEPKWKRSCLKTSASLQIDSRIPEGSGLVAWDGKLWTHNDSGTSQIFTLDTINAKITGEYELPVKNRDWEEISQDENYFYVGDFGNNSGKRDSLSIYRIAKSKILKHDTRPDTIRFAWPDRINPDCEAMVVINDSIYLFTKEWKTKRQTRVFALSSTPGKQQARYKTTLKTKVLITGATFDDAKKRLILCGYNLVLRPFLLVFDGISNGDFNFGNARKIKIRKRFRQIEGVATFDANRYYLINEDFRFSLGRRPQELHIVELQ